LFSYVVYYLTWGSQAPNSDKLFSYVVYYLTWGSQAPYLRINSLSYIGQLLYDKLFMRI